MRRICYTAATLCVISLAALSSRAQTIAPYNFIQFFKHYALNDSGHLLNACDYLHTVDPNWWYADQFSTHKPNFDVHQWLYRGEDPNLHLHVLAASTSVDAATGKVSHFLDYEFAEPELYRQYITLLAGMNPQDGGPIQNRGGSGRIYYVADYAFVLVTFPPGIMAEKAIYSIQLTEKN